MEDRTEWHRIVTFQDGLVEMMEKHAKKGRLVYVSGKLQTRKWRKAGEDSDRFPQAMTAGELVDIARQVHRAHVCYSARRFDADRRANLLRPFAQARTVWVPMNTVSGLGSSSSGDDQHGVDCPLAAPIRPVQPQPRGSLAGDLTALGTASLSIMPSDTARGAIALGPRLRRCCRERCLGSVQIVLQKAR